MPPREYLRQRIERVLMPTGVVAGKFRPDAVSRANANFLKVFEGFAMSRPLPLGELLDEWYRWAEWTSSENRDEKKSEELTGWFEFNWVVEEDPELAWEAIIKAIEQPRMKPYLSHLAAGPLEDLLDLHGPAFIERIERYARSNAKFAGLLGGVWQSAMPDPIWKRVQAVKTP